MNRTPKEIIDWLLQHCERDRVIYNALCNHKCEPKVEADTEMGGWFVAARSRRGRVYEAYVATNPIGEPVSWHRL